MPDEARLYPAREVAAMLNDRAAALARELLPNGRREGHEWVAASPSGSSRRSMSVCIAGSKAGVWADFASDARGDGLDLVAYLLFRGDKGAARRWGITWLGIGTGGCVPLPVAPARAAETPIDEHDRATEAGALKLFLAGQTALRGTPADLYLQARGIDLAELGRQPRALRFHPACRCVEVGADLPALLAAIVAPDGKHVATHRTWLAQERGHWGKAPLHSPKKVLGRYVGGSIRLWRGTSGKPLSSAPDGDTIVLAEGIETALSVALACPEFRVLAAVSLSNLARIVLPQQAIDLIIAADNDQGNSAAEATLRRAVDRLLSEGRSVRVARASIGKDFNDELRAA